MQDADLEPEWCCPPLAKADHKARAGTREGIAGSAFGDSCKVSLQRAEVQGSLKTSELLMIYHNRVFTKFQAMC